MISLLLVLGLLAVGVKGVSFLVSLKNAPERKAAQPDEAVVRVVRAHYGEYREWLSGYARARALRRSEVAAEIAGVVEFVDPGVEAGAQVDDSTVLVRIDGEDFDTQHKMRAAQLRHDRSVLASARLRKRGLEERVLSIQKEAEAGRRDLASTQALFEQNLSSRRELDAQDQLLERVLQRQSELQSQAAEAAESIAQAEHQIEKSLHSVAEVAANQARCEIRAPYPGRVVRRAVQWGAWVNPGQTVFEILDPSRVELPVSLAARHYGEVGPGSRVRVSPHRGEPLLAESTVLRVDPVVDEASRSFMVYLELRGEAGRPAPIAPGSFCYAEAEGMLHSAVVAVPRVAFVGEQVFVAERTESGLVARGRVPVVQRWLPEVALVKSGIEEGEQVLVSNLEEVAEGTPVRIAESSDLNTASAGLGSSPGAGS